MVGQCFAIGANPVDAALSRLLDAFAGKDLICVSGDWFAPQIAALVQEERGSRPVRSVLVLSSSAGFLIERPDPRTLIIRSPVSLLGLGDLLRSAPFQRGDRIHAAHCEIEILDVNGEHKPTAVRYVFDTFLEAPTFAWTTTFPNGLIGPAPPIPVGARFIVVGAVPFATL